MMNDVLEIIQKLKENIKEFEKTSIEELVKKIFSVTNLFSNAWSKSWIGYQARVYYKNFQNPPAGDYFSIEWGFYSAFSNPTSENWAEYTFDYVLKEIKRRAGLSDGVIEEIANKIKIIQSDFEHHKKNFIDIVEIDYYKNKDKYLEKILDDAIKAKVFAQDDFLKARVPTQIITRDDIAMSQGIQYPPHISYESYFLSLLSTKQALQDVLDQANKYYKYYNSSQSIDTIKTIGTNKIFIGHGRSVIWKDLKDFLEDRLNLEWEEFNREPVAGYSNKERLLKMLDSSVFAFIILTAEDIQIDGTFNPRLNVVHEIGLFQGKLGFTKAIILLEEGCEEFSNIHGIGQIRFPKNNIEAKFEEIRKVLERENII